MAHGLITESWASIDPPQVNPNEQQVLLGGETFRSCLTNLHIRRPEETFIPADFSSFTQKGDVILGMCRLQPPPQNRVYLGSDPASKTSGAQ
ncbi:unnamed protein product, partial [Coregonus sp. 'balchen']